MPTEHAELDSSFLSRASYDTDSQTLTVSFKGGKSYTYEGVPQDVFEGLRDADSPGQYYAANIKTVYG